MPEVWSVSRGSKETTWVGQVLTWSSAVFLDTGEALGGEVVTLPASRVESTRLSSQSIPSAQRSNLHTLQSWYLDVW